jgi:hypothetical protein
VILGPLKTSVRNKERVTSVVPIQIHINYQKNRRCHKTDQQANAKRAWCHFEAKLHSANSDNKYHQHTFLSEAEQETKRNEATTAKVIKDWSFMLGVWSKHWRSAVYVWTRKKKKKQHSAADGAQYTPADYEVMLVARLCKSLVFGPARFSQLSRERRGKLSKPQRFSRALSFRPIYPPTDVNVRSS